MTHKGNALLVTGGAGYIGSHTCLELLGAGHSVVVVDNLSNGSKTALERVEGIVAQAQEAPPSLHFVQADVRDRGALDAIFSEHAISAVIHFAGLKAVGESVEHPLAYFDNNVRGTITLCQAMEAAGVFTMVFSSSATVYGDPASLPIREDFPTSVTNPYGRCKLMCEDILTDLHGANPAWRVALLRYFNPIGAHSSGRIGEDPKDIPNNLLPYIAQVAVGRRERLTVHGDDYPTPDGTGVRDYIHVVDLARGHLAALERLVQAPGLSVWNLGTGRGYSVLEVLRAFEGACGMELPHRVGPRRPGDIAACYADASLAATELGWTAELDLARMCADSWRWQQQNPHGYGEAP